jgi:hypothetical protein
LVELGDFGLLFFEYDCHRTGEIASAGAIEYAGGNFGEPTRKGRGATRKESEAARSSIAKPDKSGIKRIFNLHEDHNTISKVVRR